MCDYNNIGCSSLPEKYNTFNKRRILLEQMKLSIQDYEAHGIPSDVAASDAYLLALTHELSPAEEMDDMTFT